MIHRSVPHEPPRAATGSVPEPAPRARSRADPLAGVRLALVGSRGIPARYGGFETFAEELSLRLAARGAEVTVFCEGEPDSGPARLGNVRLEYVRARSLGPLTTVVHDVRSLWRARGRFDVVYLLGYGASFACRLARGRGTEVWINMDGLEWRRSKWGRAARAWLHAMEGCAGRRADRLVFDNRALANEVMERRGWRTVPYDVVAYGAPLARDEVDPSPLDALGLRPRGYHLVLCRCEPENHLLEIVRAHRRAWCERPLVVVSNTGSRTPYAERLLAHAGERVRFLGPIYEPDLIVPLRAHCHSYLHGHSVGGTNPSLIEAMGAGALVVAHDNPFNREVLGDAGLYFADEVGLQASLEALERIEELQARAFREAARRRIAEAYTWPLVAERYAELLLARAGRGR